ncbi:Cob(I)yrinic acid a,c-diamide adenosyltransferase [Candidatus Desulfarcum epimagneticum]|uniref:corrinoid adenosyltransferase n=1 Tax=uncultured Desulfobacteraceae bacterium TaxID=218296 RepID=A0A484HHP2_9BACT|nr:Cob(I)yrinic acid a,c-diamide adenosyltransferase [uncultured Desulfobacteraceae bacterium]
MSNRFIQGKGYTQVYTGDGKGKTTAALGLAFRAMGCGMKTYIGQFMKGQKYNELNAARMCPGRIIIEQYGKDTFVHVRKPPDPEDVEMAKSGYEKIKKAMFSGIYNIVVADEIITSHYFNLISTKDILKLVAKKPREVEFIMTGRYAPQEIIEAVDLVSEMREIKHYYHSGAQAREGIER